MAVVIDASTPSIATGTGTAVTTASFTPPNGSVVLVMYGANEGAGTDASITSITNTGTAITWTRRPRKNTNAASTGGAGTNGGAEAWTGVGTGGAITVTVNGSGTGLGREKAVQIQVLTGADTASLTNFAAASSTSGLPSVAVPGCSIGSYVFGASSDWAQTGLGTAGTGQTIISESNITGQITVHFWRSTSTLAGAGSQTMNLTAPAAEQYNVVGLEIKAAASATVQPPSIVQRAVRRLPVPRRRSTGVTVPPAGIYLVSQATGALVTGTAQTTSAFTATTPGNFGAVFVARSGGLATGALSSVVDSAGGNWTLATRGAVSGANNTRIELWFRANCPSITTLTFNSSVSQTTEYNVAEWAGLAASIVLDATSQDNSGAASSTTQTTPAIATSNAPDLVIAGWHFPQTTTSGLTAGWTPLANFDETTVGSGRAAYLVAPTTGRYSAALTLGAAGAAGLVTASFRSAASTSTAVPPRPVRSRSPWAARRVVRSTIVPPAQVVVVTVQALPAQPARDRLTPPLLRRARSSQPVLAPSVTVTTQALPAQPARDRLLPPVLRRGRSTQPVATPIVVTAQQLPPQPARDRLLPPLLRRSRSANRVPAPVVAVTVALPPQPVRDRLFPLPPRRRQRITTIVTVAQPLPAQPVRDRILPQLRRRGSVASPPLTVQVAVTAQALPPQPVRDRLVPPLLRRSRSTRPVPAQVIVVTAQALPPQPGRPARATRLPRRRPWQAEPVRAQVTVLIQQPLRRGPLWWLRSRAKRYEPTWPQGAQPAFSIGVLTTTDKPSTMVTGTSVPTAATTTTGTASVTAATSTQRTGGPN